MMGDNKTGVEKSTRRRLPLSSKAMFDLFLFSSFAYFLLVLLIRFAETQLETMMLKTFDISFIYSPFSIFYATTEKGNWNFSKIVAVYGGGEVLFFLAGLALLLFWTTNWKYNLALTWTSFILVNSLPTSMLAGSFVYEGFGIAYHWMFQYVAVRIGLTAFAIGIMLWFRPFWVQRFLRCAYSREFLVEESRRKRFITHAMILPWYAGTIALIPFGVSGQSWFWILCLAGLALVIFPLFRLKMMFEDVTYHTGKAIFLVRFPLLFVITVAVVLWLVSWYHVRVLP
jgi:hypothetical protein